MWSRPEVLLRHGPGNYMILSTGFDISIWTFNVLFDCMTGFYIHILYTPPATLAHICSQLHVLKTFRTTTFKDIFCFTNKPDFSQHLSSLSGPWLISVRVLWPRREPAVCSSLPCQARVSAWALSYSWRDLRPIHQRFIKTQIAFSVTAFSVPVRQVPHPPISISELNLFLGALQFHDFAGPVCF